MSDHRTRIAEQLAGILPSIVGCLNFLARGCAHNPVQGSHEMVQAAQAAESAQMWLEAAMQIDSGSSVDQITQAFKGEQA